jgi:hypothetical protein
VEDCSLSFLLDTHELPLAGLRNDHLEPGWWRALLLKLGLLLWGMEFPMDVNAL